MSEYFILMIGFLGSMFAFVGVIAKEGAFAFPAIFLLVACCTLSIWKIN